VCLQPMTVSSGCIQHGSFGQGGLHVTALSTCDPRTGAPRTSGRRAQAAARRAQDTERPSGGAQHRTFFLFGPAGAQPRAAGFVSRLELRPALALRPVAGLEQLLGPRFYVNAGGLDARLAPVPSLGGLFSSVSERREAERQTSWCAAARPRVAGGRRGARWQRAGPRASRAAMLPFPFLLERTLQ